MDMRMLMKFTAATVAIVLTVGVAGAVEDQIVAGSPATEFRVAQAADLQADGKPQVSEENEAVLGQNAGPAGKCDPALHEDGACPHMQNGKCRMSDGGCPHMKNGKCQMADGGCPHMQHGEGEMSGDMAHHDGGHKCQMADGGCPHMQHGEGEMSGDMAHHDGGHKCQMTDGGCPNMQNGKDQVSGEDKPAGDDKEKP